MDYGQFIEYCRVEITEAYPNLQADDLEQFWNGGMMELQRMMFRNKKGADLYQVTYDSVHGTGEVVKYVPAE